MLDIIIISIYFALVIFFGIYQSRNTLDIRNFSIADRKYSTAVLVATITSTWIIGESASNDTIAIFKNGIISYLVFLSVPFSMIILSEFIAPRISGFYDCISIGDIMGKSYGDKIKIFVGVMSGLRCILILGSQLGSMGYIFYCFLDMSYKMGVITSVFIMIIYTAIGGVKSVTIAGIIQFGVFIVAAPMICNVSLLYVDGYFNLFQSLPNRLTSLNIPNEELIRYFVNFFTLLIPACGPYTVQRLLMTQNSGQAINCFRYSALVAFIYYLLITLTALSVVLLKPDLNPEFIFPYLINSFLPAGIRGVAISGLFAIVMSSASSVMNTGTISIIHDIYKTAKQEKLSPVKELTLARISTIIIGVISVTVALNYENIINIILFANQIWISIILVPFILSIYQVRIKKFILLANMFSSVIIILFWNLFEMEKFYYLNSTIVSLIINILISLPYIKFDKKIPSII